MPTPKRSHLHALIPRQWMLAMASIFVILLLIVLGAEYALKKITENILSETLKTQVEVEHVSIGLLEGTLAFHNTRIANLKGFSKPYIFTAKTARATGSFAQLLFQNKVHVELIEIDHIQTWIQKNSNGYNYEVLLRNLQAPSSDSPEDQDAAAKKATASDPGEASDIEIREIRLTDVRTAVYDFIPSADETPASREAEKLDLTWKTMVLRNIDLGEGGRQAARHLSKLITEALLTATARKVGSLPLNLVEKGFSLGGATLKIIGKETHPDELKETLDKVGRGATEWLHRLVPHEDKTDSPPAS